jgi:hypothetical protein
MFESPTDPQSDSLTPEWTFATDPLDFRFIFAILAPVEETGNGARPHCLPRLSKAARRQFPQLR